LKSTKCNAWDNRELDVLEGYKFICFIFVQVSSTAVYLNNAAKLVPWTALDMKLTLMFTIVTSAQLVSDVFIALAGFIGAYKCL